MIMRRKIGYLIIVAFAAVACSKTTPVPLTAAEQLAYEITVIDAYLAKNGIEAVKLESGVRYTIVEMGTGPTPTIDNCVRFRYNGYPLYNDTARFDSNNTDGLKAALVKLVAGVQIGMKLMPVGTKGTIYIPSALAYPSGIYDSYNQVQTLNPNEPIGFEVEILQLYAYNSLGNYCYE